MKKALGMKSTGFKVWTIAVAAGAWMAVAAIGGTGSAHAQSLPASEACQGPEMPRFDPEVRRAVEDLLVQTDSEDGPLDRPAWQTGSEPDPTDLELSPGQQLGPYVVEAEIGVGGMGRVYRANDARLNRVVAIKVSTALFNSTRMGHPSPCSAT